MTFFTPLFKRSSLFLILVAIPGFIFAQSLIDVEVRSNVFDPANITIEVGDTVRWTNVDGEHNVNGTQATYPNNPESFGNAVGDSGWVYTFVFTQSGTYDYQCDPHLSVGMVGEITVNRATSIFTPTLADNDLIARLYPVPASDRFTVEFADRVRQQQNLTAVVFDLSGREMVRKNLTGFQIMEIQTRSWPKGIYSFQLVKEGQTVAIRRLAIE